MKTKSKISQQLEKKTNSKLVETIILTKKNKGWMEVASILSSPRRKRINLNLDELEKLSGKEKIILIPGKVLSDGEFNKKIKIVALSFSEKAREKLLKSGCEVLTILEEIKLNPSAKDIKILK